MKVLAMVDESTFNSHRKYFRWASQVLAFFRGYYFSFFLISCQVSLFFMLR